MPCQLSSNFVSATNRQSPTCILAEAENTQDFVKVRIINIGSITTGEHWVSLDDFNLPTPNADSKTEKFDLSIRYMGPINVKYENYFREIFLIDNTYTATAATLSSANFEDPSTKIYGADVTG